MPLAQISCILSLKSISTTSRLLFRHQAERPGIHARQAEDSEVRFRSAYNQIRYSDRTGVSLRLTRLYTMSRREPLALGTQPLACLKLLHPIHVHAFRCCVDWVPLLQHDHVCLYTVPAQCTWRPVRQDPSHHRIQVTVRPLEIFSRNNSASIRQNGRQKDAVWCSSRCDALGGPWYEQGVFFG
jgi:hypothetical protein